MPHPPAPDWSIMFSPVYIRFFLVIFYDWTKHFCHLVPPVLNGTRDEIRPMETTHDEATKAIRYFWLLGLLNNAPWVLMLACATNISDGGVALVVSSSVSSVYHAGACSFPSYFFCIHHHQFIANQVPGLIVKITAPYWFHRVSYKARLLTASLSMGLACFLVGCGGVYNDDIGDGEGGNDNTDSNDNVQSDQWFGLFFELIGVSFISLQCNLGEVRSRHP
jgi:hypothetical protein